MANPEHLKILMQGVEVWNRWREKNPATTPDLRKISIPEADFSGIDFRGAVLSKSDFRESSFINANCQSAKLREVNFSDSQMQRANLRNAKLRRSILRGANLQGSVMIGSDMMGADCHRASLREVDLRGSDVKGVDFSEADLWRADLRENYLQGVTFRQANLEEARLQRAYIEDSNLSETNCHRLYLNGSIMVECDLRTTKLAGTYLIGAQINRCNVALTDFSDAQMSGATISDVDLSEVVELSSVKHTAPSSISTSTLALSRGQISEIFLKGCGFSDWEIEATKLWNLDLSEQERIDITDEIHRVRGERPIQINRLFVSYSHADTTFVEKLEPMLDERGIRFWRDVHDMKAGRMEMQIDRAIRLNPTVLLVLSENSVVSDWVEWEVAQARKIEKELSRDILCPVALDKAWKTCSWPGPLRRQIEDYHVLDFSSWRDRAVFERQFGKLIDGLGLFYRGTK